MLIGFNTGSFHKFIYPVSKEAILLCKKIQCNSISLSCGISERIYHLRNINKEDLNFFKYVSIHAPNINTADKSKTKEILDIIEKESLRLGIKNIVFHPESIKDWNIFKKYSFRVMIENLDSRNSKFKYVKDFEEMLKLKNINMLLDLNHCYSINKNMKLADDFVNNFKEKIVEVHVSGFKGEGINDRHVPLYKTKQKKILRFVPNINLPISIESELSNVTEAKKEYDYIVNNL